MTAKSNNNNFSKFRLTKNNILSLAFVLFLSLMLPIVIFVSKKEVDVKPKLASEDTSPQSLNGNIDKTKTTYKIPVALILFLPDENNDGIIDKETTDYVGFYDSLNGIEYSSSVNDLRKKLLKEADDGAEFLTEGSKYHGYKDSNAISSLEYSIDKNYTYEYLSNPSVNAKVPLSDAYRPDYKGMLSSINICDLVDKKGIKEIWMWTQHTSKIEPAESKFSSGYGDFSNSERSRDMPICNKSYTLYNYNFTRGLHEAIHNHGHQIESLFTQSNTINGNTFWSNWAGVDSKRGIKTPGCGHTHIPANSNLNEAVSWNYDYSSNNVRESNCEDWKPDGSGTKQSVSCSTWTKYYYPNETSCTNAKSQLAFYKWWMQNIPGYGNDLYFENKKLRNWWDYIGDMDNVYKSGTFLTLPSTKASSVIINPIDGSILSSSTQKFEWNTNEDAIAFEIKVGKKENGNEYYGPLTVLSSTKEISIFNLPSDGSSVYVTLTTYFADGSKGIHGHKYISYSDNSVAKTTMLLRAKATSYQNQYPYIKVFINGSFLEAREIRSNSLADHLFSYTGKASDIQKVAVEFTNDASGNGEDRNLYIDYIKVGDKIYQAEDKLRVKYDTGLPWDEKSRSDGKNVVDAREDMLWSGTLIFNTGTLATTNLVVRAKGNYAIGSYPKFKVLVNGTILGQERTLSSANYADFIFSYVGESTSIKRADVIFTNDACKSDGLKCIEDRNLYIDYMSIDSKIYQAEDKSKVTYDRGLPWDETTWLDGKDVISGQEDMLWSGALRFAITL